MTFTLETENNNKINYLDIALIRCKYRQGHKENKRLGVAYSHS
jgi:hypothetical protein